MGGSDLLRRPQRSRIGPHRVSGGPCENDVQRAVVHLTESWLPHLPKGTDPKSFDVLRERTLPSAWLARWGETPNQPTLFTTESGWLTAEQLEERSRKAASLLQRAGLSKGDRTVISCRPSATMVAFHIGALRLGLVVVPMNPSYREREVSSIVRHCEPKAAVIDQAELEARIRAASATEISFFDSSSTDVERGIPPRVEGLDLNDAGEPALLCYTSGTTGAPKGVLLSHANILAGVESVRIAWRWEPADRLVLALPLFHVHGLGVGLHGTLLAGASAVLLPLFDSSHVLRTVDQMEGTLFFAVPQMYARLVESLEVANLAKLRLCVSGSAPLSPELFKKISERANQIPLERYGMTETLMNVSNPYEGERREGTVGFPLPGVHLELGDEGEILLTGPNVFRGYFRDDAATEAGFDSSGRFRTGDVGQFDADGYLRIIGRVKDLIITGGFNVYPLEVENVLREHPDVEDVAVIGTPSPEWGEAVTAYVVASREPSASSLIDFASDRLVAYKLPKIVRFVDSIPRNLLGKVASEELRRMR